MEEASMANDGSTSPFSPADNPAVAAHVNLLQGIITRLANNSASCKTWCLTLVGALVSLAGATHVPGIITFALVPVVIFGFLDVMYLAQEKAYRDLYKSVVNSIHTGSYKLSDVYNASSQLNGQHIWDAFLSWSILPVYLGLIATYLIARFAGWFVYRIPATK